MNCEATEICASEKPTPDFKWRIDFSNDISLHNWVDQFGLYCTPKLEISFIGSSFFVGAFVGSFMLPRAADVVGRKPMFLLGLVLYFLVITMLVFCKSLYLSYFILFLGGISETGRYYVAYVYCVEMMPTKYQNLSGLMIFVVFGCLQIMFSIYFWFISKQWVNLAYAGGLLTIVSFFMTILYLPESPRFYFGKKRFDEARKVLKQIAVFNGYKNLKTIKF